MNKPALGFWQIWNMCFGFLGIQMGFALQNANVSRIFQTLGASVDDIPILWIAAPVTGLVVQPIVGYYSDRTWTRLGRRRPYFLGGAILASLALVFMPNSPGLWIAAGTLWIMDASINVSMEPFRAFVGDNLPPRQRTLGFAMQSFFIGVGAVAASALPWLMTNWLGISNTAPAGEIPLSVKYAFYVGAAGFFIAVLWTVISSKEYPPDVLLGEEASRAKEADSKRVTTDDGLLRWGGSSLATGLLFALVVFWRGWDQQLHVLAGMAVAFGLLQLVACLLHRAGRGNLIAAQIVEDLYGMPRTMRQLALVQFFSWFGLFTMWIYSTPAVTARHFGATDPGSAAYNTGADWVGVLFAAYSGFAALAAFLIPVLANRFGRRLAHLFCMVMGGVGLASFAVISDPALVAPEHGRRRYRLGRGPVVALRDPVDGPARRENGRVHGNLQFLHRDSPTSGRRRAWIHRARGVQRQRGLRPGPRRRLYRDQRPVHVESLRTVIRLLRRIR